MIDLSKIRVGDEVTVRGKVAIVHHDDTQKPVRLHGGSWIDVADIISHTPKPREFKPGDMVIPARHRFPSRIVAIDNGEAWLRHAAGNHSAEMLSDLRHADESE